MGLSGVIGDRFEIDRLAGQGGMGAVYRAWDRVGGVVVALKVLHYDSDEHLARFARESRLLSHLDHPGIVRFVTEGTLPDGDAYLVMEWLDGESLAERLDRSLMTIGETLTMAAAVAAALGAAHERGVTHRDLKPGNIFLVDRSVDRVKVVDFGIARVADSARALTATEQMLGTPGYMSPEQMRSSREVGPSTDVYALGCVMFKAMAGRTAFVGDSGLDVILKAASGTAPLLSTLRSDMPPELDQLVAAMLATDQWARPVNGLVVAQMLNAMVASRRQSGAQSWRPPAALGVAMMTQAPATTVVPAQTAGLSAAAPAAPQLDSYAGHYGSTGPHYPTHTPLVATQVAAPGSPSGSTSRGPRLLIGLAGLGALGLVALAGWIVLDGGDSELGSGLPLTGLPGDKASLPVTERARHPNPRKVKPLSLLPRAKAVARRVAPKAQLLCLSATNVKSNHIDLTDAQSNASFEFTAADPEKRIVVSFSGSNLFAIHAPRGPAKPIPDPGCTIEALWRAALVAGFKPTRGVMLTYVREEGGYLGPRPFWAVNQLTTANLAMFDGQTCKMLVGNGPDIIAPKRPPSR
ncbi:MAG: hypothetical protein DRI90_13920 [Deltaproteobacteria bacterium]|nr:MAG: hypothetical protein DRI90_13920 [Deltaproteobacteria bacterium]